MCRNSPHSLGSMFGLGLSRCHPKSQISHLRRDVSLRTFRYGRCGRSINQLQNLMHDWNRDVSGMVAKTLWRTYQRSSGDDARATRQEVFADDVLHDHQAPSEFPGRVRTRNERRPLARYSFRYSDFPTHKFGASLSATSRFRRR